MFYFVEWRYTKETRGPKILSVFNPFLLKPLGKFEPNLVGGSLDGLLKSSCFILSI